MAVVLGGDGRLYLVGVHAARLPFDVDEDGLDAIPPEGMRRCDEAIRCRDDLSRDMQGLKGCYQWQCSVGEKADVRHFEVFSHGSLKLLVETAVVGDPFAVPNLFQQFVELVEVGKEWGCYGDSIHSEEFYLLAYICS